MEDDGQRLMRRRRPSEEADSKGMVVSPLCSRGRLVMIPPSTALELWLCKSNDRPIVRCCSVEMERDGRLKACQALSQCLCRLDPISSRLVSVGILKQHIPTRNHGPGEPAPASLSPCQPSGNARPACLFRFAA